MMTSYLSLDPDLGLCQGILIGGTDLCMAPNINNPSDGLGAHPCLVYRVIETQTEIQG